MQGRQLRSRVQLRGPGCDPSNTPAEKRSGRSVRFDHTAAIEERVDQPIAVGERGTTRLTIGFGVAPWFCAAISKRSVGYYRKRHRFARMSFDLARGRMVRLEEEAELA